MASYKNKKCYHILTMYETLCQGGNVDLKGCCEKFGISAVTFRRYIALLKEFFKDDKGLKLVNDRKNSVYFIRGGVLPKRKNKDKIVKNKSA